MANQCQIAQKCVTDYSEANCDANQVLLQNEVVFNCCPICRIRDISPLPPPPGKQQNITQYYKLTGIKIGSGYN